MEATRLPNWFSVKPVYMSDEKPRVSTFVRVTPLDIFQDMSGQFSVVVVVTKLGIFVRLLNVSIGVCGDHFMPDHAVFLTLT